MSFDKDVHNFLTGAFNRNNAGEKPGFVASPPPSIFDNNKLPWEPDRVVTALTTDGHAVQMVLKGNDPNQWHKPPSVRAEYENNRTGNSYPLLK